MAQIEDNEPALLLEENKKEEGNMMLLNETKVTPKLGVSVDRLKSNLWYLDNGASQLSEAGNKVVLNGEYLWVYDKLGKLLMKVKRSPNRLYKLIIETSKPACLVLKSDKLSWLWHSRLGYVNFQSLTLMQSNQMVEGLPNFAQPKGVCADCLMSKKVRKSFPSQSKFYAIRILELIHCDLCGPISPETLGGNKYFVLLVDEYSRIMWLLTRDVTGRTPSEAWKGEKLSSGHVKVFKCLTHMNVPAVHTTKLNDQSMKVIHLGNKPEEVELDDELLLMEIDEPRNYTEAANEYNWSHAMESEMKSIEQNNTWELTELPSDRKGRGYIELKQLAYAKKILEKFGMEICNPTKYPMDSKEHVTKDEGGKLVNPTEYRIIIDVLRYLMHTRPDISYSVGIVSHSMEQPTLMHKNTVKRILRYIKGTINFGLVYSQKGGNNMVTGYSDRDLGGQTDDKKIIGGLVFYLNVNLVTWVS
ncbi:uncharacterized protein LOC141701320 [Apium graveolens]|uniref:uncharacterized protein LOC141701320 n=1 Tax=Apium graveolens TaxID=4045 RepID=UPI003D7BC409